MASPQDRMWGQANYQQNRFESQNTPMTNLMGYNYGRAAESDYGNYTDIMNRYRGLYDSAGGGGDGGGGGGFSAAGMYTPFTIGYNDPFNSYGGFTEFSNTGGFSKEDIANMRARGVGPVRSAYANAEREIGRQRSLQGGYAPNAIAAQVKMARERGQASADAVQNVEAGLAEMRQKGRLAGLTGMSGIEGQRLDADLKVGMFNAQAQQEAQAGNIAAAERAAAAAAAASAEGRADQFRALQGMGNLYGTTPGMTQITGNQLLNATGQSNAWGQGILGQQRNIMGLPTSGQQALNNWKTASQIAGQVSDVASKWFPRTQGQGR